MPHIEQRPLREFLQVVAARIFFLADQADARIGSASIHLDRIGHRTLHRRHPLRLVIEVIAQWQHDQSISDIVKRGTNHYRALGNGPRITGRTGSVGGTDQENQLLRMAQRVAGGGRMADMERLETANEDQVFEVHENPSRFVVIPGLSQEVRHMLRRPGYESIAPSLTKPPNLVGTTSVATSRDVTVGRD